MFWRIFRTFLLTSAFIWCALLALYLDGRWVPVGVVPPQISSLLDRLGLRPGTLVLPSEEKDVVPDVAPVSDAHGSPFSCTTAATGIAEKPKDVVYQWRDGGGRVHFGDTPPENAEFREVDVGDPGKDYFALSVSYPAGPVPADIRTAVEVGGNAIYRIYADILSLAAMSKADIDVKVFGNPQAYQQYRTQLVPGLSAAADGFYSWERNEAAVLHKGSAQQTQRTALHEATHVINAHNFGASPKWFNEGTAEYFENLVVRGQMITIEYSPSWLQGMGRGYVILPIAALLSSTPEQWESSVRNDYYMSAWALVYFLMLPENRPLMADFQRQLARDKCVGVNSVAYMDSHYPGGVAQLERNLRRWLKESNAVPTSF